MAANSTRSSRRHGRSPVEQSWRLEDAKAELIRRYGVSEPTAHVTMQRFSMECRIPLEEACDIIRLGLMAMDHLRAADGN
jgi:AmiR/NasT family two-component response regulator